MLLIPMYGGIYTALLERFPSTFVPRDIQRDILLDVDEKIKSGYKKIVLCAPTGVGKSLVGATISRHFGRSFTVTASKHLQNQYVQDIPFLLSVKGKQNFPCLKIMHDKHEDDEREAIRRGLTCEKGRCQETRVENGKEITETCVYKPSLLDVEGKIQRSDSCHYYVQKYKALVSPHSLWNYHSYFQIMKYNKKLFWKYLDRKVAVFDEAHKIEDQIVQFVGYDIARWQVEEECNLNMTQYDLTNIDDTMRLISDMTIKYAEKIRDIKESPGFINNPDYTILERLESKHDRAAQCKIDILANKNNFVINDPLRNLDGDVVSVSVKPIDISEYAKEFFTAEYQMFMSATIDKTTFCENMGLKLDDVAMIDTPKSPFPLEHRQVEMLNVRPLSYRSTTDDEIAVIKEIDRIMDEYEHERGLILTSSIPRCRKIMQYLSPKNTRRVRMCHSKNKDGKTQDEVIAEHAKTPGSVLLSSSLWEGVDLKDDLSRFQIVAKVPYPNYQENRTRVKMKKFPRWYTSQTLTKLLQGLGRSIRSEDDWAKTYVLDGMIDTLLSRAWSMIPMAYHDVLETSSR